MLTVAIKLRVFTLAGGMYQNILKRAGKKERRRSKWGDRKTKDEEKKGRENNPKERVAKAKTEVVAGGGAGE